MTRREQVRELTLKLLACTVPTAVLVGAMFAVGGKPAAVAVLIFGGLAAIGLATSVRTIRAAPLCSGSARVLTETAWRWLPRA